MEDSKTSVVFTIKPGGKGVPYGGRGELREDGSANYGFKALKGKPEEAVLINEVQDEEHFRNALVAINGLDTPFFTVGCEKSFNEHPKGYWARGYLEFAFNYCDLVEDAQYYFKLFFDFTHYVWKNQFNEHVQYHFELEGAHFFKGDCDGYTVAVWINVSVLPTEEEVKEVWGKAVDLLTAFLTSHHVQPLPAMY